ncbi:hypothetical protein BCE_1032 [Bacillus cereus ATCC 10987]|uniref:Uncharacterized protein n=1 Tax=Bacillus cereus (strain ATCC 10987 / NRS 248) TaxID=222523 RepID=Q73CN3_BACC1|nr:hypothetical protein BCE_1032 [Bacillus cereus ATCC 10987]
MYEKFLIYFSYIHHFPFIASSRLSFTIICIKDKGR